MAPFVSILVPFHDDARTLRETLDAIARQTVPPDEIVLVDDGSTDGGGAIARERAARDPRIVVLAKSAGGEASALNAGLDRVFARPAPEGFEAFVGIVEADVVPAPDWLERLLAALADAPDAAGAGGILAGDPRDPWIARLAGYEVEERFPAVQSDVVHVTSAAALYRRRAAERGGRFREDLVNAGLDSEWNGRLRAAGWRLRFTPEARATHRYKPTLAGYLGRQFSYARYRRGGPDLFLYPRDRLAALEMACTWAFLAAGVGLLLAGLPAWLPAFLAVPAIQIPFALRVLFRRGDLPAALGALAAFPVRYVAAGIGVLAGLAANENAPAIASPGRSEAS